MERIVVVGCPGAGKSTAALALSRLTGLPVIHLDRYYWQPGWGRPAVQQWREQLGHLCQQPQWIMDGNYGSSLDIRLKRADTLIHLDFSTWTCLYRAIRRMLPQVGQSRSDPLPVGCRERFDLPFLLFIFHYRKRGRVQDLQRMAGFTGQVHHFRTPAELQAYLQSFG